MFINKISINYTQNYNQRRIAQEKVTNPTFKCGAIEKPIIKNEYGAKILDKAIKLAGIIPERSKMSKPSFISLIEDGINKKYGILVDKKSYPNISKIIIKDLTEKLYWSNVKNKKDIVSLYIDNSTGKMTTGYFNGFCYSNSKGNNRKVTTWNSVYIPTYYGADLEEMCNVGEQGSLGSIFWSMTAEDASIFAK